MGRWSLVVVGIFLATSPVAGQDIVRYRARTSKGEWPIQEAKGKIENESLAGVKIAGNLVPAGDIVDVEYETPGGLRIDLREARQAEETHKTDEAVRKYRALAASPAANNSSTLKRSFEYKIATLTSVKADAGPTELRAAIAALAKWMQDNPDSWQRLQATRLLARLHLDADPPNVEAARRTYEELAAATGVSANLKSTCQLAIVDLYLSQHKNAEAKRALDAVDRTDPRVAAYRIACAADAGNVDASVKQVEELLAKADDNVKPTIYNLLGDCRRLDPKREKDARFAYLYVELIYNHDAGETAKAQDRIAELSKKLGQEERAKLYRDKARGRG